MWIESLKRHNDIDQVIWTHVQWRSTFDMKRTWDTYDRQRTFVFLRNLQSKSSNSMRWLPLPFLIEDWENCSLPIVTAETRVRYWKQECAYSCVDLARDHFATMALIHWTKRKCDNVSYHDLLLVVQKKVSTPRSLDHQCIFLIVTKAIWRCAGMFRIPEATANALLTSIAYHAD
jgi:hypothetical protein